MKYEYCQNIDEILGFLTTRERDIVREYINRALERQQEKYSLLFKGFAVVTSSPKDQRDFCIDRNLPKPSHIEDIDWNTETGWKAAIREYVLQELVLMNMEDAD